MPNYDNIYATVEIRNVKTPHVLKFRTECNFGVGVTDQRHAFCFNQMGRYLLDKISRSIYTGELLPFLGNGIREAATTYPSFYYYKGESRILEITAENLIGAEVIDYAPFVWIQVKSEIIAQATPARKSAMRVNNSRSITLFPDKFPKLDSLSVESCNQLRRIFEIILSEQGTSYFAEETIHCSNSYLEVTMTLYDSPRPGEKV